MADVQKVGRTVNLRIGIERYDIVESGGSNNSGTLGGLLKARVSLVKSGQHVEYTLRLDLDGQRWTRRKRFAEVAELHEVLKKRLASVPDMPAKSAVRHFTAEYIEGRKVALNAYLQELCKRRDALNCVELQQFFGFAERLGAYRQPHSSEPVQRAQVNEAAFGIANFAYDATQGVLLLGVADTSWMSRMDTKITNIKLPWEPEAPNLPTSRMSLWRQSPADLRFDMAFTCRYSATVSCVAMLDGLCLCGLSNGTVGCHSMSGKKGVIDPGPTMPLLKHTDRVVALAVDEAERWIISASRDLALIVYDCRRQMIQCEAQTPAMVTSMTYCQHQKRLFCGLATGRIAVYDTSVLPLQKLALLPEGNEQTSGNRISCLDYDSATSTLFAGCKDGIKLWSIKSGRGSAWGRPMGQLPQMASSPRSVAWMASSREILAGFANGAVVVFDLEAGEPTYALQAHSDEVTCMLWLDAPRRLLTASKDKSLKIWDFPSLRRLSIDEGSAPFATPQAAPMISSGAASNGAAANPLAGGYSGAASTRRSGYDAGDAPPAAPTYAQERPEPPSLARDPLGPLSRGGYGGGFAAPAARPAPTASAPAAPAKAATTRSSVGTLRDADSDDDGGLVGWDS
eukprot:TRINITY_DN46237_c0_g1_i1.p1 TRINITY_DN46237_c0_g1~~TRINITY_DN46237_c0_g1_i1.p1  ORF type:complete len:626 (+),score=157.15 TRINITY_DN46237_c0_g1_i1:150-2027(+)